MGTVKDDIHFRRLLSFVVLRFFLIRIHVVALGFLSVFKVKSYFIQTLIIPV